jgi:hypothetical protein
MDNVQEHSNQIEELLEVEFSMQSVPRLYSESHQEKLDCQKLRTLELVM